MSTMKTASLITRRQKVISQKNMKHEANMKNIKHTKRVQFYYLEFNWHEQWGRVESNQEQICLL